MLQTIVGKRGRGKTSLAAEIIASQRRDRIFIYDYMAEFHDFAIEGYIDVEQNTGSFSDFMQRLWTESEPGKSTLVVLDEIAVYGKDNPQIDHLYRLGRHKGIDVVAISQRFYSLPVIVRSQTDIFHVFQITELRDRQYIKGLVSPEILDVIVNLGCFQYINISL
jgi:hypothetical protein